MEFLDAEPCTHCGNTRMAMNKLNPRFRFKQLQSSLDALYNQYTFQSKNSRALNEARVRVGDNEIGTSPSFTLAEIISTDHNIYSEIDLYYQDLKKKIPVDSSEVRRLRVNNKWTIIAEKVGKILNHVAHTEFKSFRKQINAWLQKNPITEEDRKKLRKHMTVESILAEKPDLCQLICTECGTLSRTFYDIERHLDAIRSTISMWENICLWVERFESSLVNWDAQRKEKLAKQRKARAEKKRLEEIERLEAEQKAVQERLKKLKKGD